jgi:hypothetical protein
MFGENREYHRRSDYGAEVSQSSEYVMDADQRPQQVSPSFVIAACSGLQDKMRRNSS